MTWWCWQAYRSTSIIVAAYLLYKYIWTSVYCTVLPTLFNSDPVPYKSLPLRELRTFGAPPGDVNHDPRIIEQPYTWASRSLFNMHIFVLMRLAGLWDSMRVWCGSSGLGLHSVSQTFQVFCPKMILCLQHSLMWLQYLAASTNLQDLWSWTCGQVVAWM